MCGETRDRIKAMMCAAGTVVVLGVGLSVLMNKVLDLKNEKFPFYVIVMFVGALFLLCFYCIVLLLPFCKGPAQIDDASARPGAGALQLAHRQVGG